MGWGVGGGVGKCGDCPFFRPNAGTIIISTNEDL